MARKGLHGSDMSRYLSVAREQTMKIWKRTILGRRNTKQNDPEVGTRLVCLRNTKQPNWLL